ncbi:GHKL domain-containing protein [Microbacterium resistens]|nr:GHKL domain-containing protein [Microbacterium resistens]
MRPARRPVDLGWSTTAPTSRLGTPYREGLLAEPRGPVRLSLAAQLLVLQLVVLAGALSGVLYLSLGQSLRTFEEQESRRTLSTAESLAASPLLRALLPEADAGGAPPEALLVAAESARGVAGLSETAIVDAEGRVVASTDPTRSGKPAPPEMAGAEPDRSWTGTASLEAHPVLLSRAPVLDETGALIGVAVAVQDYPEWPERIRAAVPDLLVTLAVFGAIGVGGSYLLSRRLKRQTLGMEPGEIAELVEHREALIRGVKEGVVAVDADGRVSVLNEAARELLGWQSVREGQRLDQIDTDPAVRLALAPNAAEPGSDAPLVVADRLLVVNRRPIRARDRAVGTVTTLRDRTELLALEEALGASRTTTDLLRAQTHEFANQMHTVSGLLQTGEAEQALRYISGIALTRSAMVDAVTEQIADPPLAALLIAKSSVAAERRVSLLLDEDAQLGAVAPALSNDLITVVGNLIDNAFDAVSGQEAAEVDVDVRDEDGVITVTVQDSGPGFAGVDPELLIARGVSTKEAADPGGRGYGLALVRHVCRRNGGDVTGADTDGAVFTATLLRRAGDRAEGEKNP